MKSRPAGSLASGKTYREYYLAGAAMNKGSGQLNIPHQYDSMAEVDTSVANPNCVRCRELAVESGPSTHSVTSCGRRLGTER
jgi:hypothetical protein